MTPSITSNNRRPSRRSLMSSTKGSPPKNNSHVVDIVLWVEDPLIKSFFSGVEKTVRQLDTTTTTYSRLKDLARYHLKIVGEIELWLIHDTTGTPVCLDLQPDEPISRAIKKDCKILVEQIVNSITPSTTTPSRPRAPKRPSLNSSPKKSPRKNVNYKPPPSQRRNHKDSAVNRNSHKKKPPLPPLLNDSDSEEDDFFSFAFDHDIFETINPKSNKNDSEEEEEDTDDFNPYYSDSGDSDSDIQMEIAKALSLSALDSSQEHRSPEAGETIARASYTQFALGGGKSACTSICLVAAAQLLSQPQPTITTELLDDFLQVGAFLRQRIRHEHCSVDDLWSMDGYEKVVEPLVRRDTPFTGRIGLLDEWETCLLTALSYAQAQGISSSMALIITKPPESILLFCQDVFSGAPWLFFDSHGDDFDGEKRAYINKFGSLQAVTTALCRKFPAIPGMEMDESVQMQQLNMFEAHPILCSPVVEDTTREQEPDTCEAAANQSGLVQGNSLGDRSGSKTGKGPGGPSSDDEPRARVPPPSPKQAAPKKAPKPDAVEIEPCIEKENDAILANNNQSSSDSAGVDEADCKPSAKHDKALGPTNETGGERKHDNRQPSNSQPTPALLAPETRCSMNPKPSVDQRGKDTPHDNSSSGQGQSNSRAQEPQQSTGAQQSPRPALLHNDDLVRDPISGALFADPVFCDKGHTHERSCIEAHFRARKEMKEEEEARLRREGRSSEVACGAGRNYEPTCPLTNEPISDILIPNDQCDRMLPLLIESGLVNLEEGELEDWKSRREEKTRLARERQSAATTIADEEAQQASVPEIHSEAVVPEIRGDVNSLTVRVVGDYNPSESSFDLGLAVALCPRGWEKPTAEPGLSLRCSNTCCRTRLNDDNRTSCSRCSRFACSGCVVFHVSDAGGNDNRKHAICPDCVLQIRGSLESSSSDSKRVEDLDSMMTGFFAFLKAGKADLQHQVLHFQKHEELKSLKSQLEDRLSKLQETKASLSEKIQHAKEAADAARREEQREAAESSGRGSPSTEAVGYSEEELRASVSVLQEEYDNINWADENDVIRGSVVEKELEEAMQALAMAQSAAIVSPPSTSPRVAQLEADLARVQARWSEVMTRGPINDEDIHYAIQLSRLSDEHDKLSAVLLAAKEAEEEVARRQQAARAQSSQPTASPSRRMPLRSRRRARRRSDNTGRSQRGTVRTKRTSHPRRRTLNGGYQQVASALSAFFSVSERRIDTDDASVDSHDSSYATAGEAPDSPSVSTPGRSPATSEEGPSMDLETSSPKLADIEEYENAKGDLAAIGVFGVEEVYELPLDLHYPSPRMRNHARLFRTELDLSKLQSEHDLDYEYSRYHAELESRVETVEDEVVALRSSADETTREAQRLQEERRKRREAAERERARREEERRKEEGRLRAERRRQESATREALRGVDLRQCGRCGYGPFEKFNCNNMAAHNDFFSYIDAQGRRQRRRRNECPQCRWTNGDWNQWPKFRG